MSVVIRHADAIITAPSADFANEKELEQILAEKVELLQAPKDRPLALVDSQVKLVDAGTLDLLCVDSDGLPVAVEVKLARNAESRRSVVAQVVDYLSALATMTVDEVDLEVDGKLEEALKTFEDQGEEGAFGRRWKSFGANLRAGFARLIVAVDESPADLRRIVRFLSDRSNLDIRLVEISKFVDAGVGTVYVPTVVVSSESEQPTKPGKKKQHVPPEEFMATWSEVAGPAATAAFDDFVTALESAGIEGLRQAHYPSGTPYFYLDTPFGDIGLLRLADPKVSGALLRDLLHMGPLWEENPGAGARREEFRATLVKEVPGAVRSGKADRVYIPVKELSGRGDRVVAAVVKFAQDIRSALDEGEADSAELPQQED